MRRALAVLLAALALAGCGDDMSDQARTKPYREPVPATPAGAVPRSAADERAPPLDLALVERGRERFGIFCTPCHGRAGDGRGMIVERGFPAPPSFHIDRLREAPTRHFYDVITDGWGAMYSYAARVPPRDRWAIAAYIRALQASQDARVADLPPDARGRLQ